MSAGGTSIIRDWEPGDGIRCRFAKRAPANIPCGLPVRTRITKSGSRPGGPVREWVTPMCANHAGGQPGTLSAAADKAARERLIAAHYEEYLGYLKDESARVVDERLSR